MSNMSPQNPSFNRGVWKKLESQVRNWAVDNEDIHVVTAPVLRGSMGHIGANGVSVPKYYIKAILDNKRPEIKAIGFIIANQGSKRGLQSFAVTIDSVENFSGLDLFTELPDSLEDMIEGNLDLKKWSFSKSNNYKKYFASTPSKTVQCMGITKSGKRCRRMTKKANGFC